MTDIICINDQFEPEDHAYFQRHGITTPTEGHIYSIREVIPFLVGPPGLLLNEIVNPPTPKVSPTTGLPGLAEQAWSVHRFTDLHGNEITAEQLKAICRTIKITQP